MITVWDSSQGVNTRQGKIASQGKNAMQGKIASQDKSGGEGRNSDHKRHEEENSILNWQADLRSL